MTIVEFLLARIAWDEALAEAAIDDHPHWLAMGHDLYQYEGGVSSGYLAVDRRAPQGVEHIANWDPARVLAECQAKRAIIEQHRQVHVYPWQRDGLCAECGDAEAEDWSVRTVPWPCLTLRHSPRLRRGMATRLIQTRVSY